MGNISSQEHREGDDLLTPQNSNTQTVHPLLNPQSTENKKTLPTASSTTIMAHNDNNMSDQVPYSQNQKNSISKPDVTMSGTGASQVNLTSQPSVMSIDGSTQHVEEPLAPQRRRSTLILTDDADFEKLKMARADDSVSQSQDTSDVASVVDKLDTPEPKHNNIPIEINWFQGGENVFITGSFTGWRKMIKLNKESDEKFSIKLRLPVGTHRFRFIVDNELRFSDYLPTATDQMGNFVNYIEIQSPEASQEISEPQITTKKDSNLGLTNDDDDMGNGFSRFHEEQPTQPKLEYIRNIPAIFTDPSVMEHYYVTLDSQNQNQAWLTPPQLPPHLESVILNNYSNADKTNASGALPIPNHVVLNHLATTSIKHNTLAVASVVRYKQKYVTQVLYAPL
jgi:hypothetical protein